MIVPHLWVCCYYYLFLRGQENHYSAIMYYPTGGNTEFFLGGGGGSSMKNCNHVSDQALIKKQLGICIENTCISELMLWLHRGTFVNLK